jgi:hypothetical protein
MGASKAPLVTVNVETVPCGDVHVPVPENVPVARREPTDNSVTVPAVTRQLKVAGPSLNSWPPNPASIVVQLPV